MSKEMTVTRLELIAAKAKQLAEDLKHGKLWPGDLAKGAGEIGEQLDHVIKESVHV